MKSKFKYGLIILAIIVSACNTKQGKEETIGQKETIFPKGEKIESNNFKGTAWLKFLVNADSINQNAVGSVTFEPGARTNWHLHPNGQIILAIEGKGFYQEKGSPKRILQKGDVVKCPANTPHWHGASDDSEFIQIAITSRINGPTEWLEPVNDEAYNGITSK